MKYTEGFKKVRTLAQAMADERIREIEKLDADEFEGAKYSIDLADGYEWDESGGLIFADSVKEVCYLINNCICYPFDVIAKYEADIAKAADGMADKYAEAQPVAVCCITNLCGLALFEPDEDDRVEYDYIAAMAYGDGWQHHQGVIVEDFEGDLVITYKDTVYSLSDFLKMGVC